MIAWGKLCGIVLPFTIHCIAGQHWHDRIKLGGEVRGRPEFTDEGHYLHRVRLNLRIEAAPWLRFMGQVQDARLFGNDRIPDAPPLRDPFDLRLGYVELGNTEGAFGLRAGRQELTLLDQRLLGPSNWANAARSFDAVRVTWRPKAGYKMDAFAASVVNQASGQFNKHVDGNNLHGIYASLEKLLPNSTVDPYLLWRIAPGADFKTLGVRWTGKFQRRFDCIFEMVRQEGRIGNEPLHAWAGHWVLGVSVRKTRWLAEYNYATGDSNPADGRRTTFENLYPTPHDKYGLADRVGWRNIHHYRYGVEYAPRPKWRFVANYHTWWLATTQDGLYSAPGALIARKPDAPGHVGQEADLQGFYTFSKELQIGGGYGRVFPGAFLKAALPGRWYHFPYVMTTWTF